MPPAQVAGPLPRRPEGRQGPAALRRLNIQSMVNCTPPRARTRPRAQPVVFEGLRCPFKSADLRLAGEDAAEHFGSVLDFIASRLHHGGVLVHCNRGVSVGDVCCCSFVRTQALDPAAALVLVRAATAGGA